MKVESVSFAALTFLALLSAASFAQDRASPVAVPAQAPPSAARQAAPAAAQRSGAPAGLLIGAGDLLDVGIHVMTAVNIQHLETLNDAVARSAGIQVRETVPDSFLKRADEVVNIDVTIDELRTRLKQGKIYKPEKIEQALRRC